MSTRTDDDRLDVGPQGWIRREQVTEVGHSLGGYDVVESTSGPTDPGHVYGLPAGDDRYAFGVGPNRA